MGPAIELEAVLHTEQLGDVRHMLELRLGAMGEAALWAVVTATNELVTNALVHGGRCLGLRAYVLDDRVRVEVDDPSPVRIGDRARLDGGLAIVGRLSTAWGDEPAAARVGGELAGPDPTPARPSKVAKTVWCEIEV